MSRSPIYRTHETRVLYVRPRRWRRRAAGVVALIVLLLAGVLLGRGFVTPEVPRPLPTEQVAPASSGDVRPDMMRRFEAASPTPLPAPVSAPPAPPAPAAAPLPTPLTQMVSGTGGAGLALRDGPGIAHVRRTILPEGMTVTIIGAEVAADGYTWQPVREPAGAEGWVAAEYLE